MLRESQQWLEISVELTFDFDSYFRSFGVRTPPVRFLCNCTYLSLVL